MGLSYKMKTVHSRETKYMEIDCASIFLSLDKLWSLVDCGKMIILNWFNKQFTQKFKLIDRDGIIFHQKYNEIMWWNDTGEFSEK
jgi:hypothetical protein